MLLNVELLTTTNSFLCTYQRSDLSRYEANKLRIMVTISTITLFKLRIWMYTLGAGAGYKYVKRQSLY